MNNDYVKDKIHLFVIMIQILKMRNMTKVKGSEMKMPEQDINHVTLPISCLGKFNYDLPILFKYT